MAACVVQWVNIHDLTGYKKDLKDIREEPDYVPLGTNKCGLELDSFSGSTQLKPSDHLLKKHLEAEELLAQTKINQLNESDEKEYLETQDIFKFLNGATPRVRKIVFEENAKANLMAEIPEDNVELKQNPGDGECDSEDSAPREGRSESNTEGKQAQTESKKRVRVSEEEGAPATKKPKTNAETMQVESKVAARQLIKQISNFMSENRAIAAKKLDEAAEEEYIICPLCFKPIKRVK